MTERLTHGDFQVRAALPLILKNASRHSLKKNVKDREATGRPPQGGRASSVICEHVRKSLYGRSPFYVPSLIGFPTHGHIQDRAAPSSSFVTTNRRPPSDSLRPGHGNRSHAINSPHGARFDL